MAGSREGNGERGNLERLGASTGAMAGKAADFGMELTGAFFRSAAEVLGGWWSGEGPRMAADAWTEDAERDCRTHFGRTQTDTGRPAEGAGGTQATTSAAPKSASAAMKADSGGVSGSAEAGGAHVSGEARLDDSASDGFERARAGYQLGWVAKQNPAYRERSFEEVEPELRQVWESRASAGGDEGDGSIGLWPEVRGYVDYGFGRDDARR